MASNNTMNWYEELPLILLGFRSTIKDDIESTPSELVYGQSLRIPGELVLKEKEYHDHTAMLSKLREYFNKYRSSFTTVRPSGFTLIFFSKPRSLPVSLFEKISYRNCFQYLYFFHKIEKYGEKRTMNRSFR